MTLRESKLKRLYDNSFVYRLCVALVIGGLVFHGLASAFEIAVEVGPKVGEVIFDLTHPNQLGQMVFEKD